MTSMIITYDLYASSSRYDDLIDTIKGFSYWAHITNNSWFIKTDLTCAEVRDRLTKKLYSDDRLFVGALTGEAAWIDVLCKSDYLKEYL